MRELPIPARVYVTLVIAAGTLVTLVASYVAVRLDPGLWRVVVPLLILSVVAIKLESPMPGGGVVTVATPVLIASVLLVGPLGAAVVAALSAVIVPHKRPWFQVLFNGGMYVLMVFAAGTAYQRLGGVLLADPHVVVDARQVLLPYLGATVVHEAVNAVLFILIYALAEGVSPMRTWYGTLAQQAFPMFVYTVFGLLLAVVWSYIGPLSAVLVLAPLAVARWVFAEFALRQKAYDATMRSLIKSVETKDLYTRGHSERVSRASVLIGRRSGMREDRVASLRYAGMLHDVGKLGVPTQVLQKAGRLTDEEYEAIQQHPVRGREIVKDLEFLGEAIEGILLHHERIDGRGYPMGKTGSDIPEFARIIAVADAFDSMTTTRSYRGARSVEDAFEELRRCKGSQFDPVMVEALIEAVGTDGWDVADTLPTDLPAPFESVPTMASDDDDPTAAERLGLPSAAPDDASELDDDAFGEPVGGERP